MSNHQPDWMKYFDADTVTKLAHIGYKPAALVEGHLVGNHRSPFHGFAIEFAGHRQYVQGDDPKHIDWRAYYKTEKYLIKQYEQETNFSAHLIIDVSESMSFEYEHGRKIDYAAFIAVALSYIVISQSDTVGAYFVDNKIRHSIKVSNTEEVLEKIADEFKTSELKSKTALKDVLSQLAERIGRRQVIFVISDFFGDMDATFDGVQRLMDDRHEIILLQIVDPLEMDFSIQGRVRIEELEGDRKMDLVGSNIRTSYNDLFNAYLEEFKQRAMGLGVDYVLCSMDKPFGFHLAEYLSKRMLR